MRGFLVRYRDWLQARCPKSPLLAKVNEKLRSPGTGPAKLWPRLAREELGLPLSFRALRQAPVNEQGVVLLFGMVAKDLGFQIEIVQKKFPDCEALRPIDKNGSRWQRVRIEFEYKSSNFRAHRHDCKECDVIVCWEHDWPQCPLEVIELRKVVGKLAA